MESIAIYPPDGVPSQTRESLIHLNILSRGPILPSLKRWRPRILALDPTIFISVSSKPIEMLFKERSLVEDDRNSYITIELPWQPKQKNVLTPYVRLAHRGIMKEIVKSSSSHHSVSLSLNYHSSTTTPTFIPRSASDTATFDSCVRSDQSPAWYEKKTVEERIKSLRSSCASSKISVRITGSNHQNSCARCHKYQLQVLHARRCHSTSLQHTE